MAESREAFSLNSLYIAGFTQAQAPHLGLLVATSASDGVLFHIRVDRATSPTWQFQSRKQVIDKDMFLSSLLRVHDAAGGEVGSSDALKKQLQTAAAAVPPPANDTFGECAPWVFQVLQRLQAAGVVQLGDIDALAKEVDGLARGSRAFARRDKFPNVAVSQHCQ